MDNRIDKEVLRETVDRLMSAQHHNKLIIMKIVSPGTVYYKLQAQEYGGNGVYYNTDSNTRFSLSDRSRGVQYLAASPHTACQEFYQQEKFIGQNDYITNCMAEIRVMHHLRVFDETLLAPHLGIAVGDLMAPKKTAYAYTQRLATALASYADGLEYLSRYTGKPCIVLWSDRVEGNGALSTDSVIPLCHYKHNGRTAKHILKYQLGIRIVQ